MWSSDRDECRDVVLQQQSLLFVCGTHLIQSAIILQIPSVTGMGLSRVANPHPPHPPPSVGETDLKRTKQ